MDIFALHLTKRLIKDWGSMCADVLFGKHGSENIWPDILCPARVSVTFSQMDYLNITEQIKHTSISHHSQNIERIMFVHSSENLLYTLSTAFVKNWTWFSNEVTCWQVWSWLTLSGNDLHNQAMQWGSLSLPPQNYTLQSSCKIRGSTIHQFSRTVPLLTEQILLYSTAAMLRALPSTFITTATTSLIDSFNHPFILIQRLNNNIIEPLRTSLIPTNE